MGIVYLLMLVDKPNLFKVDVADVLNLNEIYFKYDNNVMIVFLYQINNTFIFNHYYHHIQALHNAFPYELGYFIGQYVPISTVFLSTLVNIIPAKSPMIENFDKTFMIKYQKEDFKQFFAEGTEEDLFFDGAKKLLHVFVKPIDDDNLFYKFRFLQNGLTIMSFNTKFMQDKYGKPYFKNLFDKHVLEETKTYNMLDPTFQKSLKKYKKKHNNCILDVEVETMLKNNQNSMNAFDIFHRVVSSDCIINSNFNAIVEDKKGKDFIISFSIEGEKKKFLMKKVDNIFLIEKLSEEEKDKSTDTSSKTESADSSTSNQES